MDIQKFYDDFGNIATIEKLEILPYMGASKKEKAFRLSIMAGYEDNFLYHVSVHETEKDAINEIKRLSCGTFK